MQKSVGLQFKLITIATLEISCILAILAKRAQEQSTKRHRACMKHLSTKVLDPKPTKNLTINQVQVCCIQKWQSANDSKEIADLHNGNSDVSTAFTSGDMKNFGPFDVKIG